jgi:hypothetical protein
MKKLLSTISYELENLALFEDRRFLKESSERYLFVNTKFLEVKYNKVLDPKKFILSPTSLSDELGVNFIEISELKSNLTTEEYNILLFELIKNVESFDQMNILIIPLLQHQNYSKELINYFLNESLRNSTIRRSFEVQRNLLNIVVANKELIESDLFFKILSEFPHQSGGLGWVQTGKL